MASTLMLMLSFLCFVMYSSHACPTECTCSGVGDTTVICSSTDIASIPLSLSPDTKLLTIVGSREAPFSLKRLSRADFTNLRQLVHLKISFTQLETIDEDAFFDLISLKRVDLANNKLAVLLPNTFSGLRNLTFISLSNNAGLDIQDRVFWNIPALEELYLSGLDMSEARPAMFYGLNNLKKLDLSSNDLTFFSPDVLMSVRNLWSLDLAFNKLGSLHSLIEPFFMRMKRVQLGGNLWQCNCLLKWLKRYPKFITPPYADAVVCEAPSNLKFHHLVDVDESQLTCAPPAVLNCPQQVTALEGETVTIRCLITGEPYPVITWEFADGSRVAPSFYDGMSIRDRSAFRVTNIPLDYNGKITITAKNHLGTETAEIEMIVQQVTTITTSTTTSTTTTTMPTTEAPKEITPSTTQPVPSTPHEDTTSVGSRPVEVKSVDQRTSKTLRQALSTTQTPQSPLSGTNIAVVAAASAAGGAALVTALVFGCLLLKKVSTAKSAMKVNPYDLDMSSMPRTPASLFQKGPPPPPASYHV